MSARVRRVLIVAGCIVALLAVISGLGVLAVRRSFPRTEGRVQIPGLDARVDVYRDSLGIPHIYASTEHDLFMAQGYVHAQDRFWQMDFWRHIGAGRLAEMFGEDQVETDKFLRTLGWARVAEQELALIDPQTRSALDAYAEGVNAYLANHQGSALSLEYAILKLLNPTYRPERWTALNTVTWGKVMAWDLGANMSSEVIRATLLRKLGSQRLADLFPGYPSDHPVIVPEGEWATPHAGDPQTPPTSDLLALPTLTALEQRIAELNAIAGGGTSGIGSNNWVISGERTSTGTPLLANDVHLDIQMPSIWYENGLHCAPLSSQCRFDVVGFSFAGVPAVIIGHNAHIVWGVTNVDPDVQDLYMERINPQNPYQYEVNGEWVDMDLVEETIHISGGDSQTITVRYTRHGPLLSDVDQELAALGSVSASSTSSPVGISLKWTALEPGSIIYALMGINTASNWDEFRQALRSWSVPSQNFVYADVEGNIGYQMPGRIPVRANGDGQVPVPGWTDDFEWLGYIPFDKLPSSYNPEQGYVVTANNAVVGPDYPYLITSQWDLGYRAQRIVSMIEADTDLSIEDIQRIQGDNFNAMGPILVPLLAGLEFEDEGLAERVALLQGWDFQDDMDSAPAALFNAFWHHLVLRTFSDDLPQGWLPVSSQAFLIVSRLVNQPDSPWWDDLLTSLVEQRDDMLQLALADAVTELESTLGEDATRWTWGDLHTATFRNGTLGESGIAPIEALFNRGPFRVSGGASIVNATSWRFEDGYEVAEIPSERMIADVANFDQSLSIHSTGQSGHAYHPHYIDMADLWRSIGYHPMLWSAEQVRQAATEHLVLSP